RWPLGTGAVVHGVVLAAPAARREAGEASSTTHVEFPAGRLVGGGDPSGIVDHEQDVWERVDQRRPEAVELRLAIRRRLSLSPVEGCVEDSRGRLDQTHTFRLMPPPDPHDPPHV